MFSSDLLICRGRPKSRPLRRHGLLAQSADDPKARWAVSAWAVWLFGGNEHRPATAPVAGVSAAPVAWIWTALYTLVEAPREVARHGPTAATEHVSKGLKQLAKAVNAPVLALCQLNRALEARDDKRPVLADLRQSGSIEQDAQSLAKRRQRLSQAMVLSTIQRFGRTTNLWRSDRLTISRLIWPQTACSPAWNLGPW